MTVIIGAISQGRAYLAGDSYMEESGSGVYDIRKRSKVRKVSRYTVLGACGDCGPDVYVRSAVKAALQQKKRISKGYMEDQFQIDVFNQLKALGYTHPSAGDAIGDVAYILSRPGRLYYLDSSLSAHEVEHPYMAAGAGRDPAMGMLAFAHAKGYLERDPEGTLMEIMGLLSEMSSYVSGPFDIEVV